MTTTATRGAWYAWLRRRRWKVHTGAAPGENELLRIYEKVQRRLRRRRAPPETPLEYEHAMSTARLEELTASVFVKCASHPGA